MKQVPVIQKAVLTADPPGTPIRMEKGLEQARLSDDLVFRTNREEL